jgi:hypothetical protein
MSVTLAAPRVQSEPTASTAAAASISPKPSAIVQSCVSSLRSVPVSTDPSLKVARKPVPASTFTFRPNSPIDASLNRKPKRMRCPDWKEPCVKGIFRVGLGKTVVREVMSAGLRPPGSPTAKLPRMMSPAGARSR